MTSIFTAGMYASVAVAVAVKNIIPRGTNAHNSSGAYKTNACVCTLKIHVHILLERYSRPNPLLQLQFRLETWLTISETPVVKYIASTAL